MEKGEPRQNQRVRKKAAYKAQRISVQLGVLPQEPTEIELASDWRKANPEKVKGYNDKQKKLRRIEAERKKLDRASLEAQASIFRDPQAAEHFKWLAERVRRKKEQSLLKAAR